MADSPQVSAVTLQAPRRYGLAVLTSALVVLALLAGVAWTRATVNPSLPQFGPPSVSLTPVQLARSAEVAAFERAIPVLTYHDISDDRDDDKTVTTSQFAGHLQALRTAGFESVSMRQVEDFVYGRPVTLPARPIVITFDDGISSTWTRADRALKKYGFRAVAFLVTGSVSTEDRPSYYLNTGQIAKLDRSGRWEFGAHTHALHTTPAQPGGTNAPALVNRIAGPTGAVEDLDQWRARVRADIAATRIFFTDRLGGPPTAFAYPFAAYGRESNDPRIEEELPNLLAESGIFVAFIGEQGAANVGVLPDSDPLHLHRLGVDRGTTVEALLDRISATNPTPIPGDLTALPWTGVQAACQVERNPAHAVVTPTAGYGRCSLVANTVGWLDYAFDTTIRGADRDTTAIVSLRDPNTPPDFIVPGRLEVSVGESVAIVREVLPSGVNELARIDFPFNGIPGPAAERRLRVHLQGPLATVQIDEIPPVITVLDPSVASGGIALRTASRLGRSVQFDRPQALDIPQAVPSGITVGRSPWQLAQQARSNPAGCPAGTVALTFDDGPGEHTPAMLDLLALYQARATFFVLGSKVTQGGEVLRRAVSEGHVIANHTWDHPRLTETEPFGIRDQVEDTNRALEAAGVPRPQLFRPPYGLPRAGEEQEPALLEVLADTGLQLVRWSVDSSDFRGIGPEQIVRTVVDQIAPNAIVVMHDGLPTTVDTLAALPAIITVLRGAGYCTGVLVPTVLPTADATVSTR